MSSKEHVADELASDEWRRCAEKLAEELRKRKPRGLIPPLETTLALAEFYRLRRKYIETRSIQ